MVNFNQIKIDRSSIFVILVSWITISISIGQVHNPESLLRGIFEPVDDQFLINNLSLIDHPAYFKVDTVYYISSEFAYHDIYSEWLNDKLILSSNQYDVNMSAIIPFSYHSYPGIISLNFDYGNFSFKDHESNDDADASITNWPKYGLSGTIGLQANQHRLGLFWLMEYASTNSNVYINKYYHDPEDELLNRYFYDLLEPTFGEKIKFEPTHKRYAISGEYVFSYQNRLNSGLIISKQIIGNNYRISYINSTDRLAGQKKLYGPVIGDLYNFQWINEFFLKQLTVRTDIGYEESDILFNLNAVNPTKSGDIYIDIRELADSSLSMNKFGCGLGLEWEFSNRMNLALSIATGKNSIKGEGEVKTPVLGFELLPIAHQFDGGFNFDLSSWVYGLNWKHQILRRFGYNFIAGYSNSQGILTYDNLAKMEFGIGTSRLQDKIKYRIHMYQAALKSSLKIWENYILKINIQQIVPDINKRKVKKESIPGEPSGKKKRTYWGGTIYSIGLEYQF